MIELSRERRRVRRRRASGVRRLQRGCSSAVSVILSHHTKHLYYCGGTILLERKFPHIAPIRVDRPKLSAYSPPSARSQETFCIST